MGVLVELEEIYLKGFLIMKRLEVKKQQHKEEEILRGRKAQLMSKGLGEASEEPWESFRGCGEGHKMWEVPGGQLGRKLGDHQVEGEATFNIAQGIDEDTSPMEMIMAADHQVDEEGLSSEGSCHGSLIGSWMSSSKGEEAELLDDMKSCQFQNSGIRLFESDYSQENLQVGRSLSMAEGGKNSLDAGNARGCGEGIGKGIIKTNKGAMALLEGSLMEGLCIGHMAVGGGLKAEPKDEGSSKGLHLELEKLSLAEEIVEGLTNDGQGRIQHQVSSAWMVDSRVHGRTLEVIKVFDVLIRLVFDPRGIKQIQLLSYCYHLSMTKA